MKTPKTLLLISTTVFILFVLSALGFLSNYFSVPYSSLTRDPISVAGGEPYYGVLSNLGNMFWSITVGICSITCITLYLKSNSKFKFFFASALLTTMLLVDDLFMLHESLYPKLNLPEKIVFGTYAMITVGYIGKYYRSLTNSNSYCLFVAILFFFLSIMVDQFHDSKAQFHHLLEDGFKFVGITFWMIFFSTTSIDSLISKRAQGNPEDEML